VSEQEDRSGEAARRTGTISAPLRIFISYRREDTLGHAGRLYDRLASRFGTENVFIDVDTIEPGLDFREIINEAVGSCDVLIAVIGKEWLTVGQARGWEQQGSQNDFVGLEIRAALQRDVRVIPALFDDAEMPSAAELPTALAALSFRNALAIRGTSFHADVSKLVSALEKIERKAEHADGAPAAEGAMAQPTPATIRTSMRTDAAAPAARLAPASEAPPPTASSPPHPSMRFTKVWYRGDRGNWESLLRRYQDAGTLTVENGSVTFEGEEQRVVIASVRSVTRKRIAPDAIIWRVGLPVVVGLLVSTIILVPLAVALAAIYGPGWIYVQYEADEEIREARFANGGGGGLAAVFGGNAKLFDAITADVGRHKERAE
jgi:TIR domain